METLFLVIAFVGIFALFTRDPHASQPNIEKLLKTLTDSEKSHYYLSISGKEKNPGTAFLFCFFLGGFGAHYFYLDRPGTGVVCILFCWTFLPALFSIFKLFFIHGDVKNYNSELKAFAINSILKSRNTTPDTNKEKHFEKI